MSIYTTVCGVLLKDKLCVNIADSGLISVGLSLTQLPTNGASSKQTSRKQDSLIILKMAA